MRSRRPLVLLAVVATLGACGAGGPARGGDQAPAGAARLHLHRIGSFGQPVYVTAPPGDTRRLFVVDKGGTISVLVNGHRRQRLFLDIRGKVSTGSEQGLLSMAFAPDYSRSHRFYVDYTNTAGNSRIVGYRARGDRAIPSSARLVLSQHQPEENHNGGQLQFGPDGLLYISFGDGGGGNDQHGRRGNAQSLGTFLGKILRIDPRPAGRRRHRVPASNPFVHRRGARGEIYAYGLRNPWRFSFDRRTGAIVIGDVGQDHVEEVDFARRGGARGRNYGWRVWEGRRRNYPNETARHATFPVLAYSHSRGCSVTGGYVVRDRRLRSLSGRYVYGDFCAGNIRSVRLRPGHASGDRGTGLHVSNLSSFGQDARGRIYVCSLDGPVYRLT